MVLHSTLTGLLPWLLVQAGLWDGLCSCTGSSARPPGQAGQEANLCSQAALGMCFPAQIRPQNRLHSWYGLLAGDPNQAELPAKHYSQTGPPAGHCRWQSRAGLSAEAPLYACQSVVCQDLSSGCCKPRPPFLIPSGQAPQTFPVIPVSWDLCGPQHRGLDVHLALSFSHWKSSKSRGLPGCSAVLLWGWGIVVRVQPLLLTFHVVLLSLCSTGGCFSLRPGFWALTMLSYLQAVAS